MSYGCLNAATVGVFTLANSCTLIIFNFDRETSALLAICQCWRKRVRFYFGIADRNMKFAGLRGVYPP